MSEYAALYATSLLLVGKTVNKAESRRTPTVATPKTSHELIISKTSVPTAPSDTKPLSFTRNELQTTANEAGIEIVMQPSKQNQQDVLVLPVDDLSDGPDESRWRAHGMARRRKLLEEDQRNGGRDFSMSFDCSVQRYFSVAHWALEQFHQLYQNSSSTSTDNENELEELYLMGHRIVSFLTECLPQHPGLGRAQLVQQQSKRELDLLQKCLEDVAHRIDEQVCNHFGDDGDLFLDSMLVAEMDNDDDEEEDSKESANSSRSSSTVAKQPVADVNNGAGAVFEANWVDFSDVAFGVDFSDEAFGAENHKDSKCVSFARELERKAAESPTAETIGTTGTESLEPNDTSYTNCDSSKNSEENDEIIRRSGSETTEEDANYDNKYEDYVDHDDVDHCYDDDSDRVIRDDDDDHFDVDEFSDEEDESYVESRPGTVFKAVRLDFLRTVACEPVLYETDSEAADSWANTVDDETTASRSRPCLPSSSGVTPTCDPARIAFRDLMNKLPHESILQRNNQSNQLANDASPSYPSSVANLPVRSPSSSPTLSDILGELDTDNFDDVIDNEIKEYLDSSQIDGDPTKFVETRHEKLNTQSNSTGSNAVRHPQRRDTRPAASSYISSSSSSSSSSTVPSSSSSSSLKSLTNRTGSQKSAFSSFSRPKQQQQPRREQKSVNSQNEFEVGDWISFDDSCDNSYFADSSV